MPEAKSEREARTSAPTAPPRRSEANAAEGGLRWGWAGGIWNKSSRPLFVEDGLHLSAEGYSLWTSIVRPVLIADLGD